MAWIISFHQQFAIHHEFAIIINNGDTADIDLLTGLLLGAEQQIRNIDWISPKRFLIFLLIADTGVLLVDQEIFKNMANAYLGVGADVLGLATIPPSLHGEEDAGVVAIKVIVVKVLHH